MDNAVVGLMDPAHVPFVHNQWWWRPPSTGLRLKEKRFEPRERGWGIARHQPSGNSLAYRALFGGNVTTEIVFNEKFCPVVQGNCPMKSAIYSKQT
jgi:phenylpropionate dioxygenase-like ring-hydroxylating dioxygenase large terminal subunit